MENSNANVVTALLHCAKEEINNLNANEEFLVKDLFLGYKWKRVDKGNRTRLGSQFYVFSQGEGNDLVEALGKTPQNQQIYRKK